tara:strand:- start:1874 stop:3328 length:1455 start_codon:yes stop_codon:yes gene_type:complete
MQGITSLGYEVQETPLVPDSGIHKIKEAADMLADFGRAGDTYIVHAAEGETVIPLEVLNANPRMKKMIFTQMEEMGLEPERYIVGNEFNSINPVTGQPEFFLSGLFKGLKKIIKTVAPIILPIAAPFLLPAMPLVFATGIGSLAGNLVAGKSFKDSLKSAVIAGATAGIGNVAFGGAEGFGSGNFFGSYANPSAGLGAMKNPFKVVNPLSKTGRASLQAMRAEGQAANAQAAKEAANAEMLANQGSGASGTNLTSNQLTGAEPAEGFLKSTFSPNRASIQPDANVIASEANNSYMAQLNNMELAGINVTEPMKQEMLKDAFDAATLAAQPSFLQKYGPLAAAGGATLLAADAATAADDNVQMADLPTGVDEYNLDPTKFGFGADFYGDNPYYQNPMFLPPAVRNQYAANNTLNSLTGSIPFFTQAASGGEIMGPGTGTSDSIPAMLSDGEFVMNAQAVRGAGDGDRRKGAKRMYAMMRDFQRSA